MNPEETSMSSTLTKENQGGALKSDVFINKKVKVRKSKSLLYSKNMYIYS